MMYSFSEVSSHDRIVEDVREFQSKAFYDGRDYWNDEKETTGPKDVALGHADTCPIRQRAPGVDNTCNCKKRRRAEDGWG